MSIVLSHPTGNANVRAAANGFIEAGILAEFYTAVASFPGSLLDRLGALRPLSEIRRRRFDPALQPMTRMLPWREIGRLTSLKAGFSNLIKHETGIFSIDAVYKSHDRHVAARLKHAARQGIKAVYAYEDGAASSFQASKHFGLKCLYDLPTGYWRSGQRLLHGERERWPDWIPTMTGFQDSETKLSRKDAELQMADLILVASTFTAKTFQDFPGNLAPVKIIPYGFPPVGLSRDYSSLSVNRPLKLLFVGKLTQQKGIANLFEAVKAVKGYVKLTLVGHKGSNHCPALDIELEKHQWIPSLSHDGVLQLMREHDVLIFPSLFDGFGLVITEAMAQGTPVIATDRSAGPDLIKSDLNGWLIEAGSTQALQTAIENLISRPEIIANAGTAASETAKRRPWDVYGHELSNAIQENLSSCNRVVPQIF